MSKLQEYIIHLINGDTISIWENMDIPFEESIICDFADDKSAEFFEFGDEEAGFFYVPKKNIVYISTGKVKLGE